MPRRILTVLVAGLALTACSTVDSSLPTQSEPTPPTWSLVLHGGAGVITREQLTPEQDQAYRNALTEAAKVGAAILTEGGSALDAVEATAQVLEDNPMFNAGRGAVLDATGRASLDASIMVGTDRNAGSVAGLSTTKNPISAARAVMEKSRHVMLSGAGADQFAQEQGLTQVDNRYFITERRWQSLEGLLIRQGLPVPDRPAGLTDDPIAPEAVSTVSRDAERFGTIGVVARDSTGVIAAGTSTGGLTGKRFGRIGDSPIIGAGTYADSNCGVSGTGTGEYFIRLVLAKSVCDLADTIGIQAAADTLVKSDLQSMGGDGGIIVMDGSGTIAYSMNTEGMYRASVSANDPVSVAIFADE